jgi:hypothetical protein
MLQWTLRLGQNVTVDVVNLDVTSRQRCYSVCMYSHFSSAQLCFFFYACLLNEPAAVKKIKMNVCIYVVYERTSSHEFHLFTYKLHGLGTIKTSHNWAEYLSTAKENNWFTSKVHIGFGNWRTREKRDLERKCWENVVWVEVVCCVHSRPASTVDSVQRLVAVHTVLAGLLCTQQTTFT